MQQKHLKELAGLIRSSNEYRRRVHNSIRKKRYIYLFIFGTLLILTCLSYGNFLKIGIMDVTGNEEFVAFFCFIYIASSIYILNLKRTYESLEEYVSLSDAKAVKKIRALKKDNKRTFDQNLRNSVSTICMVVGIALMWTIEFNFSESIESFAALDVYGSLGVLSWSIFLIAFIVGDLIKGFYLSEPLRRKATIEVNIRNIIIDNLLISKINPALNERT